ncbi:MAG: hypothetical protein KKD44_02770 [Proteobacteria bacterium]|nr:hypothetical protein [Pseudomonadota bacterium]
MKKTVKKKVSADEIAEKAMMGEDVSVFLQIKERCGRPFSVLMSISALAYSKNWICWQKN